MSKKRVEQLFADKVKNHESVLGKAQGKIEFDTGKNRHFQRFENGVVLGRFNDLQSPKDLICSYGKLFHAWWGNPDAAWLGEPLEDLFENVNGEGAAIMVQRFEKGVIWCRSDGSDNVIWRSWRDWHAVSFPGNRKFAAPTR